MPSSPNWPTVPSSGWGQKPNSRTSRAGRVLLGCATVFVLLGLIGMVGAYLEGDLGDGPATETIPRPTVPPETEPAATPEPTAREITLSDALAAGLVDMTAAGQNLEELSLTLESLTDEPLDVVVPPGLVFEPAAGTTQPMVVITEAVVSVAPGESSSWTIDVACASMHLDQPDDSDAFTISTGAASARLLRLLAVPDFADASFRVQQFAIWTITDNPARTGYVGLGSFGVGSGPSNDEMAEIKALFKKAGLDVTDYRALR